MAKKRVVDSRSKKKKNVKLSWKWIVVLFVGAGVGVWTLIDQFYSEYTLWLVMAYLAGSILLVWDVPRIIWAHVWVIVTGIVLTFLEVERTDMLIASVILMIVYILSIGKEQKASSRPSKAEGRLKFSISFIAIVVWVLFFYSWLLAVTGQLVDNVVWETIGDIFFMLPLIGIVASIVEIRSTVYITIESRTTEDFIRQDEAK